LFRPRARTLRRHRPRHLSLETLEARVTPATYTYTWTGAGTGGLWSDPNNWQAQAGAPAVPQVTDFDNLVFPALPGGGSHFLNNDLGNSLQGNLTLNSILFSDGGPTADGLAYTVTGNQIVLGDPNTPGSGFINVNTLVRGAQGQPTDIQLDMQLAGPDGARQFFTVGSGSTLVIDGHLSGTTGVDLTTNGAGTIVLTNDNSQFTGPITVANSPQVGGVLEITNSNALGDNSSPTIVQANAQLQVANVTTGTINENLIINGPGIQNQGALLNVGGSNTWGGNIEVDSDSTIGSAAEVSAITNIAEVGTTVTVTVATPNLFSNGQTVTITGVTPAGYDGTFVISVTGPNTFTYTDVAGLGVATLNVATATSLSGNLVITGVISDTGNGHNITKEGAAEVTFASVNTYRGETIINNGTLDVQAGSTILNNGQTASALGVADGTIATGTITNQSINEAGTLQLDDPTGIGFTILDEQLTLNGFGVQGTGAVNNQANGLGTLYNLSGDNVWTGNVNIGTQVPPAPGQPPPGAKNAQAPSIGVQEATSLTVTGVVQTPNQVQRLFVNTTPVGMTARTQPDVGTLIFTNANTYSGGSTVEGGMLEAQDSQALGTTPGNLLDIVQDGASIGLGINGHADSVTGTTTSMIFADNLQLTGLGVNVLGALVNLSGVNVWTGNVTLATNANNTDASIGVQPDPNPTSNTGYFPTYNTGYNVTSVSEVNTTVTVRTATPNNFVVGESVTIAGVTPAGYDGTFVITTVPNNTTFTFTAAAGLGPATLNNATVSGGPSFALSGDYSLTIWGTINPTTGQVIHGGIAGTAAFNGAGVYPTSANTYAFNAGTNTYTPSVGTFDKLGGGQLILPTDNANESWSATGELDANVHIVQGWVTARSNNSLGGTVFDLNSLFTTAYRQVQRASVFAGGTGYTVGDVLTVQGGAASIQAQLTVTSVSPTGAVTGVIVSNHGWYVAPPNSPANVTGGTGSGARFVLTVVPLQIPANQNLQATVTVEEGAALHLYPSAGTIDLPQNFFLKGTGFFHTFDQINQQGALENLLGSNTINGNITLEGQAGVGVEHVFGPSALYLIGSYQDLPATNLVVRQAPGGNGQDVYTFDTGYQSGTIDLTYMMYNQPDSISVYYGVPGTPTAVLLYTSNGPVSGYHPINPAIPYGPGPNTTITVVVDQGGSAQLNEQWYWTAQFVTGEPTGLGGITKLGSQLLGLQGDGIYHGNVDIRQGVLLDQSDTGLGVGTGTTTVETGASLVLANKVANTTPGLAYNNGGTPPAGQTQPGIQVWGEHLVLNGPGNTTLGVPIPALDVASDTTLTGPVDPIVPSDSLWRGTVTLQSSTTIGVDANSRLIFSAAIDDGMNPLPAGSDLLKVGGGELVLVGQNSYRGTIYVGSGPTGGAKGVAPIASVQDIDIYGTPDGINAPTFSLTLTLNGQTATTPALPYGDAPADVQAQLATLLGVLGVNGAAVTVTQTGSYYTVTFGGTLAGKPVPPLVVTTTGGVLADEQAQQITFTGTPTGSDSFFLTLVYNGVAQSVGPMPYPDTAADVQNNINTLLANVGIVGGTANVTQSGNSYTVTFGGTLSGTRVPLMSITTVGGYQGTVAFVAPLFNAGGGATGYFHTPAQPVAGGILTAASSGALGFASGNVVVQANATLQTDGNITIPGKTLVTAGPGAATAPTLSPTWFPQGPSPVSNGLTLGNPAPVSGQITGVSIDPTDPNTIFVATGSGGAWKTSNGGKTWQPLFDQNGPITNNGKVTEPPLFIGAIAVDPNNPLNIYVGTGNANNATDTYYGSGMYESNDGGMTWHLMLGLTAFIGAPTVTASGTPPTPSNITGVIRTGLNTPQNNPLNATINPFYGLAITSIAVVNQLPVNPATGQTWGMPGTVFVGVSDQAANSPKFGAGGAGVYRWTDPKIGGEGWFDMTGPNAVSDVRLGFIKDINGGGFPGTQPNTPGPDDDWLLSFSQTGVYSDVKLGQDDVLYMALGSPNGDPNNAVYRCDYPLADNINIPTITTPSNATGPVADTPHWYVGDGNTYPLHNAYSAPGNEYPTLIRPPAGYLPILNGSIKLSVQCVPGLTPTTNYFISTSLALTYTDVVASNANPYLYVDGDTHDPFVDGTPKQFRFDDLLGNLEQIDASQDGGIKWAAIAAPPGIPASPAQHDYLFTQGQYDQAILLAQWQGSMYVAGAGYAFTAPYSGNQIVYNSGTWGGTWSNITTDSKGNGPGLNAHALALWQDPTGTINMLIGTDGGLWDYSNLNFTATATFPFGTGAPNSSHWDDLNAELPVGGLDISLFNSVSINRDNPFNVFASTQISGTVEFTNSQTWVMVNPTISTTGGLPDPVSPYVAGALPNGMLITDAQSQGTFPYGEVVAVDPNNPNIVYEWLDSSTVLPIPGSLATSLSPPSGYETDTSAAPQTPGAMIDGVNEILSISVLRRSMDGGKTWTTITPGGPEWDYAHIAYLNSASIGLTETPTLLVDQVNSSRVLVGGNGLTPLTDMTTGNDLHDYPDPGHAAFTQTLMESLDGGASWHSLLAPITVTAMAISTYQGPFLADTNFPLVQDNGIDSYDPNTIYITDGSSVYVTKDHGTTWRNRTAGLRGMIDFSSIAVAQDDRDYAFVTSSAPPGSGSPRVEFTGSAGQPLAADPLGWTNITGNLPDVPVWKVTFDPRTGYIYVGTDQGVYVSTGLANGGANISTWTRLGSGLPNVQVRDIVLDQELNTLTIATWGRGQYTVFLNVTPAQGGALNSVGGTGVWNGNVVLAGPTSFGATGVQELPILLSPVQPPPVNNPAPQPDGINTQASQLQILGIISDTATGQAFPVTKVGQGDVVFGGANTYGGTTEVAEGMLVSGNTTGLGATGNAAMQAITLQNATPGSTQFNLSFTNSNPNPVSSGPVTISYTGTAADLMSIANALNNMAAVKAAGGFVTVTQGPVVQVGINLYDPTFYVTFGGNMSGFGQQALTSTTPGLVVTTNGQLLSLLGATPGITSFTLGFGGAVSVPISYTGTPADATAIASALNALAPISSVGGIVGATQIVQGIYAITFGGGMALSNPAALAPQVVSADAGSVIATATQLLMGAGGTIVDPGKALGLQANLFGESVQLTGDGIPFNYHDTGALRNLTNFNTFTGTLMLESGLVTVGVDSGSQLTIGGTGTITDNGNHFNLAKESPGTLVLASADTYGGVAGTGTFVVPTQPTPQTAFPDGTVIVQGAIDVANANALGAAGNTTTVLAGAQLQLQNAVTVPATQTARLSGSGINSTGAMMGVGGPNHWTGPVVLSQDQGWLPATVQLATGPLGVSSVGLGDVLTNPNDNLYIDGVISQRAGLPAGTVMGISKLALGTVTLTAANTYPGETYVQVGALRVENNRALGAPATPGQAQTSGTIVNNGGALELNLDGNNNVMNVPNEALVLNGPGTPEVQDLTVTGTGSGSAVFTIVFNNKSATLGVGASAGALQSALTGIGVTSSVSAAPSVNPAGGTMYTIVYLGSLAGQDVPLITASGSPGIVTTTSTIRNGGGGALVGVQGPNTWAGPVLLQTASNVGADPGATLTVSGVVQDMVGAASVPAPTVTKVGTGTVVLSGANTYTGSTNVVQGDLNVQNNTGLGNANVSEVQTVLLTGPLTGSFQLTFNGQTTIVLSSNTSAPNFITNVQTALNNLASIGGVGGTAVVTRTGGSSFSVAFGGSLANRNLPTMTALGINGTKVNVGTGNDGSGSTTVTPGGSLQLQGGVTVTSNPLTISGTGASTVQQFTVTGPFTLTFNGQTTPQLDPSSTQDEVQAALNALSSVGGVGGFASVALFNGVYTVAFGGSLANISLPTMTGTNIGPTFGANNGTQALTVTAPPGGGFTLTFEGVTSPQIPVGATAAQVQAIVSALPNIVAAGATVFVTLSHGTQTVGSVIEDNDTYTFTLGGPLTGDTTDGFLASPVVYVSAAGGGGALDSPSGNNVWDAPVVMTADASIGADTDVTNSRSVLNIDQGISQAQVGPTNFTKVGTGTVTFTGSGKNEIQQILLPDQGPVVTFTGGGGSGAIGVPIVVAGQITGVTMISGGSGYTSPPVVTFSGGAGSGATGTANISGGVGGGPVTGVTMNTNGSLYVVHPFTVSFLGSAPTASLAPSVGPAAVQNAINALSTIAALGSVHVTAGATPAGTLYYQVAFDTGGLAGLQEPLLVASQPLGAPATVVAEVQQGGTASNTYTGLTTVADGTLGLGKGALGATVGVTPNLTSGVVTSQTVAVTGAGSGATATATVAGGKLTTVNMGSGGSGYTTPPTVTFTGGGGTGATGTAILNANGQVVSVIVTFGGSGYTSAAAVNFTSGNGQGFTLTVNGQTTATLPYGATAGQVQVALASLPSIGLTGVVGISKATEASNTVTITTSAAHGFKVGQSVTISGVATAGYNGTFLINAVPTATTFTYLDGTSNLAASSGGTATNNVASVAVTSSAINTYTVTFAGPVAANGQPTVTGTGVFAAANVQAGDNNPQPPTFISDTLQLLGNNQIPAASAVTVQGDGLFDLNGHAQTVGSLTMNGGVTSITGANAQLTLNGNITAANDSFGDPAAIVDVGSLNLGSAPRTITVAPGAGGSVSATLLNGVYTVTFGGTLGRVALQQMTGSNITDVNGNPNVANIVVPGGATTPAVQQFKVVGPFTLTFDGQTTGVLAANATAAQVVAALNALPSIGGNVYAELVVSTPITGSVGLTKLGTGILSIASDNQATYTGTATITQGTLLADGPAGANTLNSVVINGGTLGGFGAVGPVSITGIATGGTIMPGDGPIAPISQPGAAPPPATLTINTTPANPQTTLSPGPQTNLFLSLNHADAAFAGPIAISSISESGTTVTVMTATPVPFATNQTVTISGVTPLGYDGDFAVVVTGSNTFTYTAAAGLGTATLANATVSAGNDGPSSQLIVSGPAAYSGPVLNLNGVGLTGIVDPNVLIGDSFTIIQTTSPSQTIVGALADPFGTDPNGIGKGDPVTFIAGQKFDVLYTPTSVTLVRALNETAVTVSSSANPSVWGQAVTFTATVVPEPGISTPPNFDDVVFTLDGTNYPVFLNNGKATFTPAGNLAVGTHTLTATFNPPSPPGLYTDPNYDTTNSATLIGGQVVNKATTTIGLSSQPGSPIPGQLVTVTAVVSAVFPGAGTPTGTVTFTLDGGSAGLTPVTATVNGSGVATTVLSGLTASTHRVRATYNGDVDFKTYSTTADYIVNVVKGTPGVTLTAAPTAPTAVFGQRVTLTAVLSGPIVPAGTVTFYNGAVLQANTLGSTTLAGGTATIVTTALGVGNHTINITYSGNTSFNAVATTVVSGYTLVPGAISYTVTQASTQTTLTASQSTSGYGQSVKYTASVVALPPGAGVPTGNVTFYFGTQSLGTAILVNSGGTDTAVLSINTLPPGQDQVTAQYNSDTNFAGSKGSFTETVQVASTVTVTSSGTPSVFGQGVNFTAAVAAMAPATGHPSAPDTVIFWDGPVTTGKNLGTLTLDINGKAVLSNITTLSVGSHTITVSFGGDTTYLGANGTASQVVNKAPTNTAGSSPAATVFGQAASFTVTVTVPPQGAGQPTGTVTFYDGPVVNNKALGTGPLVGNVASISGITTLAVGSHAITAVYSGDGSFATSQGTLTQVVTQASTTTKLSSSPASPVFGQAVTLSASVAAVFPGAGTPTGTVTFFNGTTSIGTATLTATSNGVGTITYSGLPLGSTTITASYSGDTNFQNSQATATNGGSVTVNVGQASGSTTVSASLNPVGAGSTVTLSATVTAAAPGSGTPTGSVSFADGSTSLGSATLKFVNGANVATVTATFSDLGPHTITATYSGDTNFLPGNPGTYQENVLYGSATTVSGLPNPTFYGQAVTLTASIVSTSAGSTGTPTGTVTFFDGTTPLGTPQTVNGGVGTLTISTLTAGNHNINAMYTADSTSLYGGSTSQTPFQQTVQPATTGTGLSASKNASTYGQLVTFVATVTVTSPPGTGSPTGTVTFYDGNTSLGTTTVSTALGVTTATLSTGLLGAQGTAHVITAQYNGDGQNFAASGASNAQNVTVTAANTTTTLTSSATGSTAVYSQSVTFSATVTPAFSGGATPTGTVTFYDGLSAIGSGTVGSNGVATFATTGLGIGSHSITAAFVPGTVNYNASPKSAAVSLNVTTDGSVAKVTSSSNPVFVGQMLTLTASVSAAGLGTATPTGTVTFYDGTTLLGSGTLTGGKTTFATSALALGTHNITAKYAGSTFFTASTSPIFAQSVTVQTVQSLSATLNPVQPQVGSPFSITVQALDPKGNLVTGDNNLVTITVKSAPAGGSLTGSTIARFSGGVATFSGLGVTAGGTWVIVITSNGVSQQVTFNSTGRLS
jgi:autotransporter-associated beta strand protein